MELTEQAANDARLAAEIAALIENPDRFNLAGYNAMTANGVESIVGAKVVEIDGVDVLFVDVLRRATTFSFGGRGGVGVRTSKPRPSTFVWTPGVAMRITPMSWREVEGRKRRKFRHVPMMYTSSAEAIAAYSAPGAKWIDNGLVPGFHERMSAVEYAD